MAHVLRAGDTGVQQPVGAGEGDVAAAGAAQQGGQRGEGVVLRVQQIVHPGHALGHLTQRRLGDAGHYQHGDEDDGGQEGGHLIHDGLGVLVDKDDDAQAAGYHRTDGLIQAEHGVEAQSHAAHVAHVEGQAADGYQNGDDIAQTGQQLVAHILGPHLGDGDHRPDVHLSGDVHDDGHDDDQGQGRPVLGGECRGLGQKAGADGRGGHQEGGAEEHRAAGFCRGLVQGVRFLTHNVPPMI